RDPRRRGRVLPERERPSGGHHEDQNVILFLGLDQGVGNAVADLGERRDPCQFGFRRLDGDRRHRWFRWRQFLLPLGAPAKGGLAPLLLGDLTERGLAAGPVAIETAPAVGNRGVAAARLLLDVANGITLRA